jgi:hypothetical protein
MIRITTTQTGILFALTIVALFLGCRKEGPEDPAARAKQESPLSFEAEEANRKNATIQFIQSKEKDFRSRLENTKAGVAKLGNKTRKKLKPDLASLDAKSVRLDSLLRAAPSLSGPELKLSVDILNATLDSANAELTRVRKFLK